MNSFSNTDQSGSPAHMTDIITAKSNATPLRSFAKTVTWRVLGSLDTLMLGYIFTGNFAIAGSIASTEVITKVVLYYLHERGWAHVKWGVRGESRSFHSPSPDAVRSATGEG